MLPCCDCFRGCSGIDTGGADGSGADGGGADGGGADDGGADGGGAWDVKYAGGGQSGSIFIMM